MNWPPPTPQPPQGDPVLERWDAGVRNVFELFGWLVAAAMILIIVCCGAMAVYEMALGHDEIARSFVIFTILAVIVQRLARRRRR